MGGAEGEGEWDWGLYPEKEAIDDEAGGRVAKGGE